MFGDASEHARADFLAIVERKDEIRRSGFLQGLVRAGLALDSPADLAKGSKDSFGLYGRPITHATASVMRIAEGAASLCSRRSARTRSAKTSALAMASFEDAP